MRGRVGNGAKGRVAEFFPIDTNPSNGRRDNVYVMQRCAHPHSQHYEIPNIHAYYSIVTYVYPASNAGGGDGWIRKKELSYW
jgi:hypothetical protein